MKKLVLGLLAIAVASPAVAQVYVPGYVKRDGTYVQGHYRSSPDSARTDNYSTRGNVNPYTGQVGTRDPYASPYRSYSPPPRRYSVPPITAPQWSSPYSQPRSNSSPYSDSDNSSSDWLDDPW